MFTRARSPTRIVVNRLEENLITEGDCDAALQGSRGFGAFNTRETVDVPVELSGHRPKVDGVDPEAADGAATEPRFGDALAISAWVHASLCSRSR